MRTKELFYYVTWGSNVTRDVHWCVTVDYQLIANGNVANQIHGFTIDYSKFILNIYINWFDRLLMTHQVMTYAGSLRTQIKVKSCSSRFLSVLERDFFVFRTGKTFISDEELRPERSASIHRSNSFLCLYSSSGMWITNRMLFDHPLYGLNIDRVLGFHDYTLGQVT